MHKSSVMRMKWFVENYVSRGNGNVLDVGSMDSTYSYRQLFDGKDVKYTGLDIAADPNVDVVMEGPYTWSSIEDNHYDYVISGQAFEHMEYAWLAMKEIYMKMKPGGFVVL